MKKINLTLANLLVVGSLLSASGCVPLLVGAAAGAGGVTYTRGALERNLDYSVEKVHKAALSALKDMDIFVTQDELARHESTIKAEYADGEKITVDIKALTERASKIKVRIGIFGDKMRSEAIVGKIIQKL